MLVLGRVYSCGIFQKTPPINQGETMSRKGSDHLPSTHRFGPGRVSWVQVTKGEFGHTKRLPETPSQTPSTSIGIVPYTSKILQGPPGEDLCFLGSNTYVLIRYLDV